MTAVDATIGGDQLRSLHIAADRMSWAEKAASERPRDVAYAGRALEARSRFALMLQDPANVAPIAGALLELWKLRNRVAILRGAIGGDPKDLAAGMPDGLTPVGTLEAVTRFAHEVMADPKVRNEDPGSTSMMITDATNFLEALRGALEATKD